MCELIGSTAGIGAVDVADGEDEVLELEVAAWGEGMEAFANHGLGGLETGYEGAAVDEVEGVGEGPVVVVFGVSDFEAAVLGHAGED